MHHFYVMYTTHPLPDAFIEDHESLGALDRWLVCHERHEFHRDLLETVSHRG